MRQTDTSGDVSTDVELSLKQLIAALDEPHDELPEKLLREAQARRQEITPSLIEVLQHAVGLKREGATYQGNVPFFAMFLLAEFRAKEALPVVMQLLELPDEPRYELIGDTDTEVLPGLLAAIVDDVETLDAALSNPALERIAYWNCAAAMVVMVQTGRLSRGEAVRRLRAHLRRAIQQDDHDRATCLVHELAYLKPREALDDIVKAFERHLVDEFTVTLDDVNFLIESEPESRCAGRSPYVEDTVEELRSWGWRNPSDEANKDNGWGNSETYGNQGLDSPDEDPEDAFQPIEPVRRETPRVGRNDPCPCGSGKKFKKCCMRRQ